MNQNQTSNAAWERQLDWFKDSSQYTILDPVDGEPMEFDWGIFPGFTTLHFVQEVQKFMNKMGEPEQFQGRIIDVNDFLWWIKDNEKECNANSTLVCHHLQKDFPAGHWSFLGPGSETKWYSTCNEDHKENGTKSLNWWWSNSEKVDILFSVQRLHCPGVSSKAKEVETYLYTSVPTVKWLKLFFAHMFLLISSVSTEQSQMCVRKHSTCQTSTGRAGQSDPLFEPANLLIMTSRPSIEDSCTRKFIAEVKGMSGNASTTRSSDQDLYWCRIPENSWSRTVH